MAKANPKTTLSGEPADDIFPDIPKDEEFDKEEDDFIARKSLQELGETVIKNRAIEHLGDLEIVFLWKRKGGESNGRAKIGRCIKPSGLAAHLTDADFVIWCAADHCAITSFTNFQMEALLYHELCHADVDADGLPILRAHDYEGFINEIKIYGAWKPDLEKMMDVARQLEFPFNVLRGK